MSSLTTFPFQFPLRQPEPHPTPSVRETREMFHSQSRVECGLRSPYAVVGRKRGDIDAPPSLTPLTSIYPSPTAPVPLPEHRAPSLPRFSLPYPHHLLPNSLHRHAAALSSIPAPHPAARGSQPIHSRARRAHSGPLRGPSRSGGKLQSPTRSSAVVPYGSCRGLYVFYASRGVLSRPNDPRAPVHGLRLTAVYLDASDELREIRDTAKSRINPCCIVLPRCATIYIIPGREGLNGLQLKDCVCVRSMQPSRMVRETSSCVHRRIFGARWASSGLNYDDPEERRQGAPVAGALRESLGAVFAIRSRA